jgi:hypothetical protein
MLFDLEARQAKSTTDVAARVFMGVGSLEEGTGIPSLDRYQMVTSMRKMADRLGSRAYPSLDMTTHVFDRETHTSVVPVVVTRGLRTVYGRRRE